MMKAGIAKFKANHSRSVACYVEKLLADHLRKNVHKTGEKMSEAQNWNVRYLQNGDTQLDKTAIFDGRCPQGSVRIAPTSYSSICGGSGRRKI